MEVKKFNIDIKTLSYGIEDIVLDFDGHMIPFCASYIGGEPISTLIESLIALEEIYINQDYTRFYITWLDEPGKIDFKLYKNRYTDSLTIDIQYDNCGDGKYKKEQQWTFEMKYSLYKQTIIQTALRVLKRFGLNGFNDSWANGKDIFPICSLISLIGVSPDFNADEENYHCSVFDEFDILKKAIADID